MIKIRLSIHLSLFVIAFFLPLVITAQEYYIFNQTQVTNNPYLYNPSIAGMKGFGNITLSVRQSINLSEGSPRTVIASFYNRLKDSKNRNLSHRGFRSDASKIGVGSFLYYDTDGPFKNLGVGATFSYHIDLNEQKTEKVSFGISPFLMHTSINSKYFNVLDDPLLTSGNLQSGYSPDVIVGVHYYGRYAYLGISSFQIFENSLKYGDGLTNESVKRKYFINGGGKYKLNSSIQVEPSFLFYSFDGKIEELPQHFDANLRVFYNMFNVTATYRNNVAISLSAMAQFDHFFVGISHEYPVVGSWSRDYGQTELTVGYNFGKGPNRFGDHRYW